MSVATLHPVAKAAGVTLNATQQYIYVEQSEFAMEHNFFFAITAVSSLVNGVLVAQVYSPGTDTWINAPQEILLVTKGSGTPTAINANSASAAAIEGSYIRNCSGIAALSSTTTVILRIPGTGTAIRFSLISDSGSGTFTWSYVGLRAIDA